LGLERLLLILENQGISFPEEERTDVFIAAIGEKANEKAMELLFKLRKLSIKADKDYMDRSLKAQMKYADKLKVKYVIIIGDEEIERNIVKIKDMTNGEMLDALLNDVDDIVNKIRR